MHFSSVECINTATRKEDECHRLCIILPKYALIIRSSFNDESFLPPISIISNCKLVYHSSKRTPTTPAFVWCGLPYVPKTTICPDDEYFYPAISILSYYW